jgi:hypothetical protein
MFQSVAEAGEGHGVINRYAFLRALMAELAYSHNSVYVWLDSVAVTVNTILPPLQIATSTVSSLIRAMVTSQLVPML